MKNDIEMDGIGSASGAVENSSASPRPFASVFPRGYFVANRHPDADELLEHYPPAILLAYVIARRARWREGMSPDGLSQGEALIGDCKRMGLTPRQYRTAIGKLSKGQFATFKRTSRGTVARLLDTRLFAVSATLADKSNDHQPMSHRQTHDKQATTNNNDNKENNETRGMEGPLVVKNDSRLGECRRIPPSTGSVPPAVPCVERMAGWQLRKDLDETTDPVERRAIRAEMDRRRQILKPAASSKRASVVVPKPSDPPSATDSQLAYFAEQTRLLREKIARGNQ